MIRQSDIAGGQGAGGAAGWETSVTVNFATAGSADWTSGSGYTVGGVAIVNTNPGNGSTFGPDGSTGVVIRTNGSQTWNATTRNTPCLSVQISDMITDIEAGQIFGVCVDFVSPVDHATAADYYAAMVEADPSDAAAWGVRLRDLGTSTIESQAMSGGAVSSTGATQASDLRRIVIITDDATGYSAVYYSVTATDGSAPPWGALTTANGWTRLDGSSQTRLRTDNAAQFDPTTDYITAAPASDCGITVQYFHAARYGSA